MRSGWFSWCHGVGVRYRRLFVPLQTMGRKGVMKEGEKATVRGILLLLQRHTLVQSFGQKNHVRLKAGPIVISPYVPTQTMQISSSCTSMVWQHSTWGQWTI